MSLEGNANIAARLAEQAQRHPQHAALIEASPRRRVLSFEGLAQRTAAVAAGLAAKGIGEGDRVLLFVPMSIELYTALLAILHLGAVAVFVDPSAGKERLDAGVRAAAPRAFLGTPRSHLLRLRSQAIRSIPIALMVDRHGVALDRLAARRPAQPASLRRAEDLALVTFTTGSTGRPKGVARSHGFLWTQHEVLARHLGVTEQDVDMPTLPVFVLHNLALGATTVLPDFDARRLDKVDAARIHRQIGREGVTTSTGSPAFYARLLAWCEAKHERLPLRHLHTGGAPVWPQFVQRLQASVTGEVQVLYGSSEVEPISHLSAGELLAAAQSAAARGGLCVGVPVPELDLRILRAVNGPIQLDAAGWKALECTTGEVGEVVVRGPHVLREYLDDTESTRRHKIRDGDAVWHRTGDGARLDEQGRLWLMGRIEQRVQRAGAVYWSTAAELRALSLPGVEYAAYFGDGAAEQRAVLCLQRRRGPRLSVEQVRSALGDIPVDVVHELRAIPRDRRHHSKTDLTALRRRLPQIRA